MRLNHLARTACIALLATALLSGLANAHEENKADPGSRWDVSLDLPVWPSLGDLQPIGGGSFDHVGFGIGVSAHWPVKTFSSSELMLGIDGSIAATPSNIRGSFETLLARQFYLGGSIKWLFGERRNLSLDAGVGYHEIDMAQVDSEWYGTLEYEHWSTSKPGGYVGVTWDIGAGRPDHNSGLFIGLRVQFADFGRVYDEEFVPGRTALGANAGSLDGPLYLLRAGFSSR
jgi:hypothetical protein